MKTILTLLCLSLSTLIQASDFIPEASAITKVGSQLVIAGDEEPKNLWVNSTLTKVKGASWDDLEGLATVDENRFYAITSHSFTKKGKRRPEREQLFLLSLGEKMKVEGTWSLREMILDGLAEELGKELDMETVRTASPDEGGFNIEGLAYHDGKLYLGLRSPVTTSGEALVVVLEDHSRVSGIRRLKLSGKGIRGLDVQGSELLVLSGSTNDEAEIFGLHRYDLFTSQLTPWSVPGFSGLERPESLALDGDSLVIVQDLLKDSGVPSMVRLPVK